MGGFAVCAVYPVVVDTGCHEPVPEQFSDFVGESDALNSILPNALSHRPGKRFGYKCCTRGFF